MSKQRWTFEEKKQHVVHWRASGLTRQQYCEQYGIPVYTMRKWPHEIAKAGRKENESMSESTATTGSLGPQEQKLPRVTDEPVILFLPDGYWVSCHCSLVADVYVALKHTET